jgi:hypothetical protein
MLLVAATLNPVINITNSGDPKTSCACLGVPTVSKLGAQSYPSRWIQPRLQAFPTPSRLGWPFEAQPRGTLVSRYKNSILCNTQPLHFSLFTNDSLKLSRSRPCTAATGRYLAAENASHPPLPAFVNIQVMSLLWFLLSPTYFSHPSRLNLETYLKRCGVQARLVIRMSSTSKPAICLFRCLSIHISLETVFFLGCYTMSPSYFLSTFILIFLSASITNAVGSSSRLASAPSPLAIPPSLYWYVKFPSYTEAFLL